MRRKALSTLLFLTLILGLLTLTSRVEAVNATGSILINADGSVTPSSAPISTADGVTYILHDSIGGSLEIDRNNVVFDGAENTLYRNATTDLGISLQGRTNVTIKNIIVVGFTTGIRLDSCSGNSIIGNTISNDSYGIHLTNSSRNTISGNTASNNGDYGIWLSSSSGNSISANTAKNNNYDGILLATSSNNNIYGNTLAGNNDGIRLESSSNNTVSTNNVADSNGYDMWHTTDNGYAFVLVSSSQNIISGNTATGSIKDGIRLESSSRNTVNENIVTNNQDGIHLQSSSNNAISENYVTKNANSGIQLNFSSTNTISNNIATDNGPFGLYLIASSSNTVSKNNLENNNEGLCFASSTSNNVLGNNVTNNADCGFKFESSSNENTVSGNNITSNGYGVWFGSSINNNIFQNNFVSNAIQAFTSGNKEVWGTSSATGNYWSDYITKYPNAIEVGSSKVGNTTYIIDSNNQDTYPIVTPILTSENTIPEFSSWIFIPLLMFTALIPIIVSRRRRHAKT